MLIQLVFLLLFYGVSHFLHAFPTRRSSDLTTSTWCHSPGESEPVTADSFCHDVVVMALRSSLPRSRRKRSEEHTSELQSRGHLVCRLLLEKKKNKKKKV